MNDYSTPETDNLDVDLDRSKSNLTEEQMIFDELFVSRNKVSEEEKQEYIKMLQKRGFQISRSADALESLQQEIVRMKNESSSRLEQWRSYHGSYLTRIIEKRKKIEEEIQRLTQKENEYDSEIAEHKSRKLELKTEIDELKTHLADIRRKLSKDKREVGGRLIADAELELKKLVELQEQVNENIKKVNEARFKSLQPTLEAIIKKYEIIRKAYEERFDDLQLKVKALGGDGINMTAAYTLISVGSATAAIAGYFFSIFSSNAKYSSNDVFNYLLNGVIHATAGELPVQQKICYFLGSVFVITALIWATDWLIKRVTNFQKESDDEGLGHFFAMEFKADGIEYGYGSKEKKWLTFWLKLIPFILIIGSLLLLISTNKDIGEQTTSLNASTEGLLIGTATAMAFAGLYYLYIIKISERRKNSGIPGNIKHSWEIVAAILALLVSVAILAFYPADILKDPDSSKYRSIVMMLSIAGFIGACIATAIVFSYGLRFLGLLSSLNEIEEEIQRIDNAIVRNSVPRQQYVDAHLEEYFEKLSTGLLLHISKKNEAILDPEKREKVRISQDQTEKKTPARFFDFLIPQNKNKSLIGNGPFDMLEWEITYFPEHAEAIKHLANICEEKQKELFDLDTKIKQCISDKASQELSNDLKKAPLLKQIEELLVLHSKLIGIVVIKEKELNEELTDNITHVQDGFDLGTWYGQHDLATAVNYNN